MVAKRQDTYLRDEHDMASVGSGAQAVKERMTVLGRSLYGDKPQFWWQIATAATVLAYFASLAFMHRPPDHYSSIWDGWVGNIACTTPIIPLVVRARRSPRLRTAWLALACGVALNDIGNLVYLLHDQNIHPVPSPAPSDVFYLLSYVGFAFGVTLIAQRSYGTRILSARLDGAIAGIAAGAVAATLWFDSVLDVSGNSLQVVVGMSYPLMDLALLMLLVAGLVRLRFHPNVTTIALTLGIVWFLVGDVIDLNQVAAHTYVPDTLLDGTWLLGIWLVALAAWPSPERRAEPRTVEAVAPHGVLVIPTICGLLSLAVLVRSLVRHTSHVSSMLAILALLLVIVRMVMTLREVRHGAVNFRDARTDELTGLGNRRSFSEDGLVKLASLRKSKKLVVLLIDLNGFKEVNDSLGHHCGDELLNIVGERFQNQLSDRGSIARIGGDEFATSCVVTSIDEGVGIARELNATLAKPVLLDGVTVRITASFGVAMSPGHGVDPADLLRSADVAMYQAKVSHTTVCTYHAEKDPNSRERIAMIDELRAAIDARELTLHFQPQLDLCTSKVRGVEALVRWKHPSRGLLYPDDIISLAEHTGLILPLTRAVLEQSIVEARRLDRAGHRLQMSVNITRYDLLDDRLPSFIYQLLAENGVPASRLTLEITESSVGEDPENAKRRIEELRERGIGISIDDYGVGYSSMSQLLDLPIDELKIDKSFVQALGVDRRARAIISSAVELARALDLTLVAEGIETSANLAILQEIGADVGQGWFIAQPLSSAELDKFLTASEGSDRGALIAGTV
jgi:diguanylate cyclase (GGDEF)-like protein